jgi:hypothetical protein
VKKQSKEVCEVVNDLKIRKEFFRLFGLYVLNFTGIINRYFYHSRLLPESEVKTIARAE